MRLPDLPPAADRLPVRRALVSLSDKNGLGEIVRRMAALGIEIVSTGGTARAIAEGGVEVRDVAELTGYPEMMDGRVKTLHPAIHGGLLAHRDAAAHVEAMAAHGIGGIDLVFVNLYPFEATVAAGAALPEAIETIDIGGPAMIRSAAKNHAYVCVCLTAADVEEVLGALERDGATDLALRRRLAARAFARTAAYDAAIADHLAARLGDPFPERKTIAGVRGLSMRYGENPHQGAALYLGSETRPGAARARVVQGKAPGYNNIADADAAFELVAEFDPAKTAAVAIIKHANPSGVAIAPDSLAAYERALACDPVSAFGGVIALNRRLDAATANKIVEILTEVVIAPEADEDAIAVFRRKKNLRLMLTGCLPDPRAPGATFRSVAGGFLLQDRDARAVTAEDLRIVTRRRPSAGEVADMLFAFAVCRHVKSNAIVFARDGQTAGIGAGQMNRRDSARIAAIRAREAAELAGLPEPLTAGSSCASDAFFPFADGLIQAAEAGATAIIQPGGAMRDAEVIAAADERGLAMAFTGIRAFRH